MTTQNDVSTSNQDAGQRCEIVLAGEPAGFADHPQQQGPVDRQHAGAAA